LLCAACGQPTPGDPCASCGGGALLDGRYRLEQVLGHGAFGTTFRAVAPDGQVVAVKELPLRAKALKQRELLEREARVLRTLHHPAIPAYREHFVTGEGRSRAFCLVEEHVDGVTLAEEAAARRHGEADVLAILDDLLGILAYLHGLTPPVLHRDLKPGNVMRRKDGRIALIDFGCVRDAVRGEISGSTMAGTFGYMAPEQFHGTASEASDLYGAGALAVALLTGREPQSMLDFAGRLQWRRHARVTPELASLIDDLTSLDPERRPSTALFARVRVQDLRRPRKSVGVPARLEPLPEAAPALVAALHRVRETRDVLQRPQTDAYEPGWLALGVHPLFDEMVSRITGRKR
jgi:serine/threonine protein kinase